MSRRSICRFAPGYAIDCSIPPMTKWDRKQYFYPDLPKGYQISQFDLPICADGFIEIIDPRIPRQTRHIGIIRAHLEEDAGKSMHDEAAGRSDSRIDLNRCGTPLLEIVSQPDLRSSAEAKSYLSELKLRMTHLGVSDCEMQEGSLASRREREPAHRCRRQEDRHADRRSQKHEQLPRRRACDRLRDRTTIRRLGRNSQRRSRTNRKRRAAGTMPRERRFCNVRKKSQPTIDTSPIPTCCPFDCRRSESKRPARHSENCRPKSASDCRASTASSRTMPM